MPGKIKFLLPFAVVLILNSVILAKRNPDSLRIALSKNTSDTARIKTLIELGMAYLNTRPDSSLYFHQKGLSLAQKLPNAVSVADLMRYVSWDLYDLGKPEESIELGKKALKICDEQLRVAGADGKTSLRAVKIKSSLLVNMAIVLDAKGERTEAMNSYKQAGEMFKQLSDTNGMASCIYGMGSIYYHTGDYDKAIECFESTYDLCKKDHEVESATGLMGLANIYNRKCLYPKALENYLKVLNIMRKNKRRINEAKVLINIGVVYLQLEDNDKALENFYSALKIYKELGSHDGMGGALGNIAMLKEAKGDYSSARKVYLDAIASLKISSDQYGLSNIYAHYGNFHYKKSGFDSALYYYGLSVDLQKKLKDAQAMSVNLSYLGAINVKLKKYGEARASLKEAIEISKKLGSKGTLGMCYASLAELDSATGNFSSAFKNFKLYTRYNDSVKSDENKKKTFEEQVRFDYRNKELADSISRAKENDITEARLQHQEAELRAARNQKLALYGGLALVMVFAGFIYNRFKVTQRQGLIIQQKEKEAQSQRVIIEEKHKEITDSINYAERILRSFLASNQLLSQHLKEHFILFRPKAVVSGDFYWATVLLNGRFAYVTADSTGHGVPGAIMSILNVTSLEKAVEMENEPSNILNSARSTIISRLKNDGSESGGRDGMDGSIIAFEDKDKEGTWRKMIYSSANSVIWVARREEGDHYEIHEMHYDKMPVGKHDNDRAPFIQKEFRLHKGDVVYTLTDGLADQFGGPKGKKFMYKRIKEYFAHNAGKPLKTQHDELLQILQDWKTEEEQVDDITVIGVRV